MAQEQRSTFTSFLSRNNGDIINLIKKIESTEKLNLARKFFILNPTWYT